MPKRCSTWHISQAPEGLPQDELYRDLVSSWFFDAESRARRCCSYWAASFANFGYPSFRVDLPGAGDSSADVPAELLQLISTGGHQRVAAVAVKQLVQRYNLSGVVILGHCAGAISAIFTAAICEECRGLILLDAPFHLPPAVRPKVREVLFHWSTRSRFGGLLSNIHDQIKNIRLFLRRNAPPENTNFPLLKRWKDLAARGLPILLINAPPPKASGTKPRAGKFDYLGHILKLAGNRSRVDVKVIESAHHTLFRPRGQRCGSAGRSNNGCKLSSPSKIWSKRRRIVPSRCIRTMRPNFLTINRCLPASMPPGRSRVYHECPI